MAHDLLQGAETSLELWDKVRVELGESDKFCDIPDQLWGWSMVEEGVF
jgi:hypothetical protein